ncbi:MAG TPA: hypothetical protein VMH02_07345 [Verrucomicrobiae bacterium]|nr:hypothetical protein [Verrucomicrobiae bacterium]
MMTNELAVSVLAAPLAAIDRRTLSQAWYSALHLQRDAATAPAPASRKGEDAQSRPLHERPAANRPRGLGNVPPRFPAVRSERERLGGAAGTPERRAPGASGARVARAIRAVREPGRCSVLRLAGGASRAVLFLQTRGSRAYVVALCTPEARPLLERTLAQARYSLAARGIALDAAIGGVPCI